MSVTYRTGLKTTRMTDVITDIDKGSSFGYIEICSSAYASVLATIVLAKPSFTESSGVITMAGAPKSDSSADNTGTAAIARIKDSDGNVIVSGLSVGTSGTDIVLNSTSITSGQAVTITSGTITHS